MLGAATGLRTLYSRPDWLEWHLPFSVSKLAEPGCSAAPTLCRLLSSFTVSWRAFWVPDFPLTQPCVLVGGPLSATVRPAKLVDSEASSGIGIIWPSGFRDRFVFGEELGKGSFGTVSVVFDRHTGRERAVKVVSKQRKNICVTKLAEKIRLEVCSSVTFKSICPVHLCSYAEQGTFLLTALRLLQVEILRELQDRPEAVKLYGVYQVRPVSALLLHHLPWS